MRYNEQMKGLRAKIYHLGLEHFSKITLKSFDGRAMAIMDVTFPILDINHTDLPFITNDVGLNNYFPLESFSYTLKTDKGNLDSILTFPLSPRLCVHLCTQKSVVEYLHNVMKVSDKGGLMLKTSDPDTIKSTNDITFNNACRFVYSNIKIKL